LKKPFRIANHFLHGLETLFCECRGDFVAIDDLCVWIHAIEIDGLAIAPDGKEYSSINIFEAARSQITAGVFNCLRIRAAVDRNTSPKFVAIKIKLRPRQFRPLRIHGLTLHPTIKKYWAEEFLCT